MPSTSRRATTALALARLFASAIGSAVAATSGGSCLLGLPPCTHVKTHAPDVVSEKDKTDWPGACAELCAASRFGPTQSCAVELFFTQSPNQRDHVTCRYPGDRAETLYDIDKLPLGAESPQALCGSCANDAASVGCLRDLDLLECQGKEFTCEGAGRRLRGVRCASAAIGRERAAGPAARWFARAAILEARSVTAFDELACVLEALGARPLAARARRAARDEQQHASTMASLAGRAAGTHARAPRAPTRRERTVGLEQLARENAVEGCVREAFGALVLTWQARAVPSRDVARSLARVARDETRHAALSFAIHRWATERLDASANKRVQRAARRAIGALRRGAARARCADHTLGLPSPDVTAHLLDQVSDILR